MSYYDMNEYYDYSSPYMETTMIGIMMICFIVLLVCAIFALLSYILMGVGMYTMAKRQGMDNAWLAFIPFARTYLHGELSGSIRLKNRSIENPGIWLLALPFLYGAVSSLFNGIVWFVGFGSITKILQYDLLYGRVDMAPGSVMGLVILFIIIAVIGVLYTAVYKTFCILVNHQILGRYTSKNMSIVHAVLSTLIPLYESICFFVMRNHPFNPGMEPPTPPPFMQSPPPGSYYGGPVPPPEPPVPPAPPAPPKQEPYGFGTADFGNGGSIYGRSDSGNSGNTESTGSVSGSGSFGSILDAGDQENAGSILGAGDHESHRSILDAGDRTYESPGSILDSGDRDQESAGSILDAGSSASILGTPPAQEQQNGDSSDAKPESPVNFVLPESENKEL